MKEGEVRFGRVYFRVLVESFSFICSVFFVFKVWILVVLGVLFLSENLRVNYL